MAIEDVWPQSLGTSILSPYSFLKQQDRQLQGRTDDAMRLDITKSVRKDGEIIYNVGVEAPSIGVRAALFQLSHEERRVYPCEVIARAAQSWPKPWSSYEDSVSAADHHELSIALQAVLSQEDVKSTLSSMMAMVNESRE